MDITNSGPMKTFSWKRLKQLDFSFHFHRLLNEAQEIESTQMDDPKDFSNGALRLCDAPRLKRFSDH